MWLLHSLQVFYEKKTTVSGISYILYGIFRRSTVFHSKSLQYGVMNNNCFVVSWHDLD
jgi:hypothetical protein